MREQEQIPVSDKTKSSRYALHGIEFLDTQLTELPTKKHKRDLDAIWRPLGSSFERCDWASLRLPSCFNTTDCGQLSPIFAALLMMP